MLDGYIIEKIRREQEEKNSDRAPLHKEQPSTPQQRRPSSDWREANEETETERGVFILDM